MLNISIYFFVIGSIAGWILEIIFKTISGEDRARAGMSAGPFCMLYGIGTYFLAVYLSKFTNNVFVIFLLSLIVLTTLEYITGVILDKIFEIELWDYTKLKFGINKHISLEFMLIWGVLGVLFVIYILPVLNTLYYSLNSQVFISILYLVFVCICVDYIYTSIKLLNSKKRKLSI